MIHAIFTAVGGDSSPLSVNSTYSEIIRLVQLGIFSGVLYLIKALKDNKNQSSDTHENILNDIAKVQSLAEKNYEANQKLITDIQTEVKAELEKINQRLSQP